MESGQLQPNSSSSSLLRMSNFGTVPKVAFGTTPTSIGPPPQSSDTTAFSCGEKMAYSADGHRKIPEGALLTYCHNLDCLKSFHVAPRGENETVFFNELLVNRYSRGPTKLVLVCPHCGSFVEALASALEVCTCGQEWHSPPHKPKSALGPVRIK
jgi:hypothetical protein